MLNVIPKLVKLGSSANLISVDYNYSYVLTYRPRTNQAFFNKYQVNLQEFYCYKSIANKQRNHSFLCLLLIQPICIIGITWVILKITCFLLSVGGSWEPLPEVSGGWGSTH